jgi:DNA polymerase I-like protein with 3'-5' exonuclease and polymerase domains
MIAMQLMVDYRKKHNLHFKLINQVHDAMMLVAPRTEIEATENMFYSTMGNIVIPIRPGHTLKLGVDITTFTRWGEKMKKTKK